jgi:hypothetical protein
MATQTRRRPTPAPLRSWNELDEDERRREADPYLRNPVIGNPFDDDEVEIFNPPPLAWQQPEFADPRDDEAAPFADSDTADRGFVIAGVLVAAALTTFIGMTFIV